MKIKVELKNGITAELDDCDAGITFVSAGEYSVMTMPIDELQDVLDIMKGASSMSRQEDKYDWRKGPQWTDEEELQILRSIVKNKIAPMALNKINPDPGIDDRSAVFEG